MLCFKRLYQLPCCVVMVVTAVALEVVVAATARVFGSGGGCCSPSSIIGTGGLPTASCRRNMCLCTQGGLGSCAFIAITRYSQVPTRQLAVCEFGMNVLVCVCVCGLLLLRFRSSVLRLVLVLTFEGKKNKHSASWPPAPALSNKTLQGLCILPGGAPTHRRWHFNTIQIVPSHPNSFTTMVRVL